MKLGELREYLEPQCLEFSVNGTDFKVEPSARKVMIFHKHLSDLSAEIAKEGRDSYTQMEMVEAAANLVDGELDDDGMLVGGMIDELNDAGIDGAALARIMMTIYVYYRIGEAAAERYYKTGSVEEPQETAPKSSKQQTEAE